MTTPTDNAWLDEIMLKPAHWQADDYAKAKQAILSHIDTVCREARIVTGETSDGYHTFNELYEFRMLYNAALFNQWAEFMPIKYDVHKSKRHSDGELAFGGGWFVVVAELPTGQITNHYKLEHWDIFNIPEKPQANEWDGHTPQDVADRLAQLNPNKDTPNE